MDYKVFPAVMNPKGTIEAVIRFYNDLNITREQLQYLVKEFNRLNPDAAPPKPYQAVQMPVLLKYCDRHENKENH